MLKLFAPMVRDIDVKRDASVLSSGCGDLTRTQMKVEFTHDVGILENLVTDGTGEVTRKDAKFVKEAK